MTSEEIVCQHRPAIFVYKAKGIVSHTHCTLNDSFAVVAECGANIILNKKREGIIRVPADFKIKASVTNQIKRERERLWEREREREEANLVPYL